MARTGLDSDNGFSCQVGQLLLLENGARVRITHVVWPMEDAGKKVVLWCVPI